MNTKYFVWFFGVVAGFLLLHWLRQRSVPTAVTIDFSRVCEEAERMINGDIPYDPDYLRELVEVEGDVFFDVDFPSLVDMEMECDCCGGTAVPLPCPECAVVKTTDCFLCHGIGFLWECPRCSSGDGII